MSSSSENTVLQIKHNDAAYIPTIAMVILLGLVQENRGINESFSNHFFAVWICPQKSMVPQRMDEVRKLSLNL